MRHTILRTVFLLALLTAFLCVAPLQANDKLYARAVKSTVLIETPKSIGAGTLVDAGQRLVVTANHVVTKDTEVNVFFAAFDAEGHAITNKKHYVDNRAKLAIKGAVIARLERCDLALIQMSALPEGAVAMPLAAQSAEPGQRVHILGHSSVLRGALFNYSGDGKVRNVVDLKVSITVVNVEGQPKELFEGRVLETSVVVREGDSGGPVLNDAGELVAVVRGTIGTLGKEKEFSDSPVNIDPELSEIKTLLKNAAINGQGSTPVVKAKPKPEVPSTTEETPVNPKTQTVVGGVWKEPGVDAKGVKFTNQWQFAEDGTFRFTKVDEEGTTLSTGHGQYEFADNKLTFKVDGKVRKQLQVQFPEANRMSVRREGGEPVTWKR